MARYWTLMSKHEADDPTGGSSSLPQVVVVEVAVLRHSDRCSPPVRMAGIRGDRRRRVIAALTLAVAIAVAGTLWVNSRSVGPSPANVAARDPGSTGVAAAYGYPPNCLSVTILTIGRPYARADFNHRLICGRYTGYPTAIFQYVSGTWRPVLDATAYICPVASLPARVQIQLDVCLPTRADRRALDR